MADVATAVDRPLDLDAPDDVVRVGLAYEQQASRQIRLRASRLHERNGNLEAELVVWLGEQRLLLHRTNLSSLAARQQTIRHLAARVPDVGWGPIIDDFAVAVLERDRRGEAFERIGNRPASEAPAHLLAPILRPGLPTLLFGLSGAGKTTLAAGAVVSVVTGATVIPGWRPLQTGPALWLDFENDPDPMNDLVRRVARGAEIEPPEVHYRRCYGSLADQLEDVADYVAREGISLIVIDPTAHAEGSSQGGDPRDPVLRMFDGLRMLDGASKLLLDHVAGASASSEEPTPKAYGSIFKLNLSREVFELRGEREPANGRREVVIRHVKSNYGAHLPTHGLAIVHDQDAVRFEHSEIEAPDLQPSLSLASRMFKELRSGAMLTKDLAERLGVDPAAVRSEISRGKRFVRLPDKRVAISVGPA